MPKKANKSDHRPHPPCDRQPGGRINLAPTRPGSRTRVQLHQLLFSRFKPLCKSHFILFWKRIHLWELELTEMLRFCLLVVFLLSTVSWIPGAVAGTSGTGRTLLAKCSRSRTKQYYGSRRMLEEIDITGKNGDSSCCWYCKKTCGCRKWDYVDNGKTEVCKLFERSARWKRFNTNSCKGCKHYSGYVKK